MKKDDMRKGLSLVESFMNRQVNEVTIEEHEKSFEIIERAKPALEQYFMQKLGYDVTFGELTKHKTGGYELKSQVYVGSDLGVFESFMNKAQIDIDLYEFPEEELYSITLNIKYSHTEGGSNGVTLLENKTILTFGGEVMAMDKYHAMEQDPAEESY